MLDTLAGDVRGHLTLAAGVLADLRHISVRAESKHGKRLNPRKADLHRWRETFAEKLRDQGVEAEATRPRSRVSALPPALKGAS